MEPNDLITLHHGLVRDWLNHGPEEVYDMVDELSHAELVFLVMMHTGKAALLSPK